MGRSAFEALGASRETAERMVEEFQSFDRDAMIEVADVYDVNIPNHENEGSTSPRFAVCLKSANLNCRRG